MPAKNSASRRLFQVAVVLCFGLSSAFGADLKLLPDHVPGIISALTPKGRLPATNILHLAIGLPLRDPAGLDKFLEEIYNPASQNYHRFLTPEEFTSRFGPSEKDYAAVKEFARVNGWIITKAHGNRLLLDVTGSAGAVQKAFHITLRVYRHPTERRDFFAPDTAPEVDPGLPVADVEGLTDGYKPRPKFRRMDAASLATITSKSGSAPDGSGAYFGDDFRNCYLPGTTLTGTGQSVGLLEFDNYYASDVSAYASQAGGGRTNIAINTVLLGGYNGHPTSSGNGEVALDIQMAMAMAPGLSKIVVYSGGPNGAPNDVLNAMAADSTIKNLCCCWGWGGGPSATTDAIFKQMAAQGQSFFDASGDTGAFTTGVNSINGVDNPSNQNAPASCPYITQVGGTTLTTGANAAYQSETVWNWGGGDGSSGGISSYYPIPDWQSNVDMSINAGSTTRRNIPDVALVSDNVFSYDDNGASGPVGGTSCAAPLWAGMAALANQQAAETGQAAIGFVNPALYAVGASSGYSQDFHDVVNGNNTWSSSPDEFYAVKGYDLCTGWGTPKGKSLIDDLVQNRVPADALGIMSTVSGATNVVGGPFVSPADIVVLTNYGNKPLTWKLVNPKAVEWLSNAPVTGVLAAQAATNVLFNYATAATNLAAGTYSAKLLFSNATSKIVQAVAYHLQLAPVLSVEPTAGFIASGPVGGPFFPFAQDFTITNLGNVPATWHLSPSSRWLGFSQSTGAVAAVSSDTFAVDLTARAAQLAVGIYKTNLVVRNQKNQIVQILPCMLKIGQNIVSNGGFETGNFNGWTLNASSTQVGKLSGLVHSGTYGAELGQPSAPGYLSQSLPTTAGQSYRLSLWLHNPINSIGATPNAFQILWEGAAIYDATNLPFGSWSNLVFDVTASASGSLLQFGFRDDPYYLGLDDITARPVALPHVLVMAAQSAEFGFSYSVSPDMRYEVQYKTNLAQPGWINLGGPVSSGSNTLHFTDTNSIAFPEKFYRLVPAP